MTLFGKLATDPKWGEQIKVDSGYVDLPNHAQGLIDYLADEVRFANIGPARARALIDWFGAKGFRQRAEDPVTHLEFAQVSGVTPETATGIHNHWQEAKTINELMIVFRTYGLDHTRAMQVVRALGNTATQLLREDPYRLIDLAGIPFREIDKVERADGINKLDKRRIAGAVIAVLQKRASEGHTLMKANVLLSAVKDFSGCMGLSWEKLQEAEKYRVDLKGAVPFYLTIYGGVLGKYYRAETEFFNWLVESRSYPSQLVQRRQEEVSLITTPPGLNEQQAEAYSLAYGSSVTWIYGLAGTGKTYSAKLICDLYEKAGMRIMLMAPTGKAAKRLTESTGRPASTIHRGLACKPKIGRASDKLQFSFEGPSLEAELILVDEVSMVDSELMAHLIRRIDLKRTSVIFLGDVNQLVPVGAGQPAVDVHRIEDCAPMVQLTEIVRQAGKLAHYCVDVLNSHVRANTDYANGWILRGTKANDAANTHGEMLACLEDSWASDYDPFADIQILTPQNKGPLGVDTLNIVLQRYFQNRRYGILTKTPLNGHATIMTGDKVIQTKNDYNLGIYNGDSGIVLEVVTDQFQEQKKGSILVDFGLTDPIWLLSSGGSSGKNDTKNLKLAYALTVHKAQGSEYPCVLAIVDQAHKHMLTRSWLYTAVTRAKETICLIGQLSAAEKAAKQVHSPMAKSKSGRQTYLRALLAEEDIFGEAWEREGETQS
jgi:exodeoxyribonuclease V alpha subunit